MKAPPEKLGSFYLGAEYDLEKNEVTENAINYDARDLTTHAVCVGMTGSGKTGLCIGLLEEAALDKVPAILIDPKGDVTNLLLQFPELQPKDFLPWVNPDDARRKGKTVGEYSKYIADLWRNGLQEWDINPDRISSLKDSAEFTIYTPGSEAGLPVSILSSLKAPHLDFDENVEAIRENINGTVAALMELAGINADPVRSREAILLSNIFEHFWRQNKDLDLTELIMSIQKPPIRQLGVFDVDTFYPKKDRFDLAMAFNSLIASSSFQSWLQGESLDVDKMLYTEEGKPRHSIFYIAHLSDRERMFFVTILLENVLMWVRRQTGTTSLRALLYFDEVFGFFPPVAEPPSKRPLLTLLKQARAFGFGVALVTQNPVDIDYKGLTNAGTWFIGKLQTERDKDRVLHGLKGAISEAGGSGRKVDYDALISKLRSRVFLMHNVHEDQPVTFYTRWVMSYLRGPLTRPQVRKLMKERKMKIHVARPERIRIPAHVEAPSTVGLSDLTFTSSRTGFLSTPPALDPSLTQVFLPVEIGEQEAFRQHLGRDVKVENVGLVYDPAVLGGANVRFVDRKRKIDEEVEQILLVSVPEDLTGVKWGNAEKPSTLLSNLLKEPERVRPDLGPFFSPVPESVNSVQEMKGLSRDLADWLYSNSSLKLKINSELGIFQKAGEGEREFLIRLRQASRERRDEDVDRLQEKYAKQFDKLENKLNKLGRKLTAEEAEYEARKREEIIGIGGTAFGFLMGRRGTSSVTSIARRRRLTAKAKMRMEGTKEEIAELKDDIDNLENELKEAVDEITRRWEDALDDLSIEEVRPRRNDVNVHLTALAWRPSWLITYNDGKASQTLKIPAYSSTGAA